jgi:hypothetical protein
MRGLYYVLLMAGGCKDNDCFSRIDQWNNYI